MTDLDTHPGVGVCGFDSSPALYTRSRLGPAYGADCPGTSGQDEPEPSYVEVQYEPWLPLSPFAVDNAWSIPVPNADVFAEDELPTGPAGEGTGMVRLWLPNTETEIDIGLGQGSKTTRTILGSITER